MQEAISVIETDCEVDFAPPLDYVEPSREPVDDPMDGQEQASTISDEEEPAEPKFQAFIGAGRRLDGKASSSTAPSVIPSNALKPGKLWLHRYMMLLFKTTPYSKSLKEDLALHFADPNNAIHLSCLLEDRTGTMTSKECNVCPMRSASKL